MDEKYRYKKSKIPTECLYVTNLGKKCVEDESVIKKILEDKGKKLGVRIKDFALGKNSHSFLLFHSIEECEKFYNNYIKNTNGSDKSEFKLGGRSVYIEYSSRIEKNRSKISNIRTISDNIENERFLASRGFMLFKNFVSDEEGRKLVDWFDNEGEWECKLRRRVQHFGYSFDYSRKVISSNWNKDIPDIINKLILRMLDYGLTKEPPDQITVNEYQIGQGIGPHIDSHHTIGESIIVVSLGSSILFDFYDLKRVKNGFQRIEKRSVFVPENSLYIMKEEIRYKWGHGIKSRKTELVEGNRCKRNRRISITFRKFMKSHLCNDPCLKCNCSYDEYCDSRFEFLRALPDRV
ncbi:2OG-Fe oxygenase superfamily [Cryptosporidium bovis]|uniref:2OG-Fe oxygenase superfamily n=1 Tax=Cryptosporidium bovis TaxID=310047 RepID=UPI00351A9536|nr:2OG-Fe oxygenase superfamily [Cryptosporidium bovis]